VGMKIIEIKNMPKKKKVLNKIFLIILKKAKLGLQAFVLFV
tara:strand:+ start:621 stop:743 length:123 start_codon:yes stop_codon:yes gene_type:complete